MRLGLESVQDLDMDIRHPRLWDTCPRRIRVLLSILHQRYPAFVRKCPQTILRNDGKNQIHQLSWLLPSPQRFQGWCCSTRCDFVVLWNRLVVLRKTKRQTMLLEELRLMARNQWNFLQCQTRLDSSSHTPHKLSFPKKDITAPSYESAVKYDLTSTHLLVQRRNSTYTRRQRLYTR